VLARSSRSTAAAARNDALAVRAPLPVSMRFSRMTMMSGTAYVVPRMMSGGSVAWCLVSPSMSFWSRVCWVLRELTFLLVMMTISSFRANEPACDHRPPSSFALTEREVARA
jgi:hypothetical protein